MRTTADAAVFRVPLLLLPLLLALAVGLSACGGDSDRSASSTAGDTGETKDATLVLDYIPNAVHAGIYRALAEGYYEQNGIDLNVIEPTSTADTLKLIDAGKADFGIADGIDVAGQINMGRDAKGIMAILQRPSGGLITLADEGITNPRDLAGRTIGVTGVPSDTAVLDAIISGAGGSPDDSDLVTIGFNGVQALEAGKLDAITGFIPADGVQIESDGFPTHSFALDEYGGPKYPGLVAFSTRTRISENPELMKGFADATIRGYQDTIADPAKSVTDLESQAQGIDPKLAARSLKAYLPLMGPAGTFGEFDDPNLRDLSSFLVGQDLIDAPIEPSRFATNVFAAGR